jgi:hypothetical protein
MCGIPYQRRSKAGKQQTSQACQLD